MTEPKLQSQSETQHSGRRVLRVTYSDVFIARSTPCQNNVKRPFSVCPLVFCSKTSHIVFELDQNFVVAVVELMDFFRLVFKVTFSIVESVLICVVTYHAERRLHYESVHRNCYSAGCCRNPGFSIEAAMRLDGPPFEFHQGVVTKIVNDRNLTLGQLDYFRLWR